jgi:hypothetical protein
MIYSIIIFIALLIPVMDVLKTLSKSIVKDINQTDKSIDELVKNLTTKEK